MSAGTPSGPLRILITGLCLQGNKGGPALGLSITAALKTRMPGTTFVFSVPSGAEFEHEERWSHHYGVDIVEDTQIRDLHPVGWLSAPRRARMRKWYRALRSVDAVLDMTAISYVGPPLGGVKGILSYRHKYFTSARLYRKRFIAWTQSYGPLSTPLVRFLARRDLKRQALIFCRGDDCLAAVQQLLPGHPARSYPDIAVLLEHDPAGGVKYVEDHFGFAPGSWISISPSAVIYAKTGQADDNNPHVRHLADTCRLAHDAGYKVVLVPHTKRPGRPDPRNCDFAVAERVRAAARDEVALVEEDLDPIRLKSIIGGAHIHVGGRYHSIVAALSTGVPCISLSWHAKYLDIMRQYGLGAFVINALDTKELEDGFPDLWRGLMNRRDELHAQLCTTQDTVAKAANENADLVVELLRG
jgi:polysaccharide pyruvyl transferase WcaK-like protein